MKRKAIQKLTMNENNDDFSNATIENIKDSVTIFGKIFAFFGMLKLFFVVKIMMWHKNQYDSMSRNLLYLKLGYETEKEFRADTTDLLKRMSSVKTGKSGGDMRSVSKIRSKRNMEIEKYLEERHRILPYLDADKRKIIETILNKPKEEFDEDAYSKSTDRYTVKRQMILRELEKEIKRKDTK